MNSLLRSVLLVGVGFAVTSVGQAASSTTSLIWESAGSLSQSLRGSSNSSSGATNMAAGDYKVLGIFAAATQPGFVTVNLQAADPKAAKNEFELLLPQSVASRAELVSGATVTVRDRVYGLEFSVAGQAQAFYLVLHDEWHRDLHNRAVTL
ncbi:MAG: hypothetical protein HEQ39_19390 [Rhizobacter sp.]